MITPLKTNKSASNGRNNEVRIISSNSLFMSLASLYWRFYAIIMRIYAVSLSQLSFLVKHCL